MKEITVKDRKALKGILEGKSMSKAMKEAGMHPSNVARWRKKPGIREAFEEMLQKKGLDLDTLTGKIKIIAEKVNSESSPKVDQNFLSLLNMMMKVFDLYAPTKVQEKKMSMSMKANVNLEDLLTEEDKKRYHKEALRKINEKTRKKGK